MIAPPYPVIHRWVVAHSILAMTRETLHEKGQGVRESGAFWLGQRTSVARISALIFPWGKGVETSPGSWIVTPEVFGAMTRWAKPQGLSLLAVVHTHLRGIPPRLSRADCEYSVQVPGMLAIVIGEGGTEQDHTKWGWYVYDNGGYRCLKPSSGAAWLILEDGSPFVAGEVDVDGVREIAQ